MTNPSAAALQEMFGEAIRRHAAGELAEAERLYRQILAADSHHADSLHCLGVLASDVGRYDVAVQLIGQAIAVRGDAVAYHANLGTALYRQGQLDGAVASYQRAVALHPGLAEAHYNLGLALQRQGKLADASACFERAVALKPGYAEAYCDWGVALLSQDKPAEAVGCLERAVALKPEFAAAHCNLGLARRRQGNAEAALACFQRAVVLRPDYAEAHFYLGMTCHGHGRLAEAAAHFERAATLNPNDAAACTNLGGILAELGRSAQALKSYQRAAVLMPDNPVVHYNLALTLQNQGELTESIARYEKAVALRPDYTDAHYNLGTAYLDRGEPDRAVACYQRAVALKPDFAQAHGNLIFALNFLVDVDTARQQAARRAWYDALARRITEAEPSRLPGDAVGEPRRLRIGYVSAYFRHQAATYAFAPVILHHDRDRFEVVCYSDTRTEDDVTALLKGAATLWRDTGPLNDEQLAAQVRADGIDILVDCVGHMNGNRLLMFARKPAPIQVTAWGEPTGTGLPAMDYLLADPVLVPPVERPLFAESVIDLPCFLTSWSPDEAPPPGPPPVLTTGRITFGSFNRSAKLNAPTLKLWSDLLIAVPSARLLLKCRSWTNRAEQARLTAHLKRYGIAAERISFIGGSTRADHFGAYQQVDICLDPLPHGGGMTTLDALWMGVPVITLRGATPSSRLASAVLSALDIPDWIASSSADYVAKATALAENVPHLTEIRQDLRARMKATPVGNPQLYACAVEASYSAMYEEWHGHISIVPSI